MSSGSSAGDPIMTDFEGHTFEFMGEVGKFYDVISEKDHQVRNFSNYSSKLHPNSGERRAELPETQLRLRQFPLQMTMKLKLGQMWDHNGTYMEGIGFRYQDHTVVIELASDDSMHGELLLFPLKAQLTFAPVRSEIVGCFASNPQSAEILDGMNPCIN